MSKSPLLHITRNRKQIRTVEITSSFFLIGRTLDCNLRLDSIDVSRRHAQITYEAGRCFLIDLNSRNGTKLNKQPLPPDKPQRLRNEDIIDIAEFQIKFEDKTAPPDTSQFPTTTTKDASSEPDFFSSRGLRLNEARQEVYLQGKKLDPPLAPKEFALLMLLIVHEGNLVFYEQINLHLWPDDLDDRDLLRIQQVVKRLRLRLEEIDKEWDYIRTRRGVGLMFVQRESN